MQKERHKTTNKQMSLHFFFHIPRQDKRGFREPPIIFATAADVAKEEFMITIHSYYSYHP